MADQPETARVDIADAVVPNLEVQHLVLHERPDLGAGSVRVLHDVREGVRDDEVRTGFDSRRNRTLVKFTSTLADPRTKRATSAALISAQTT